MNPKQKRTIGTLLISFFLILMAGDIGLMILCWKTGVRVSAAIFVVLIACFMPLWLVGVILISQAKKEEGK